MVLRNDDFSFFVILSKNDDGDFKLLSYFRPKMIIRIVGRMHFFPYDFEIKTNFFLFDWNYFNLFFYLFSLFV